MFGSSIYDKNDNCFLGFSRRKLSNFIVSAPLDMEKIDDAFREGTSKNKGAA